MCGKVSGFERDGGGETETYRWLKALVWKAQTALEKRPAPMRRRKFVITTMKTVRAEDTDVSICYYAYGLVYDSLVRLAKA